MTYNREKMRACHALKFALTQPDYRPLLFTSSLSICEI
jgi:hypothetical protein